MADMDSLNAHALQQVYAYQNLDFYGKKVNTPYFRNIYAKNMLTKVTSAITTSAIGYGKGKGKLLPQELRAATLMAAQRENLDLEKCSAAKIQNLMKLWGLGVDCSGFIYNVLSLNLKLGVFKTGVAEFVHYSSDAKIPQQLDILIENDNSHIKLLVNKAEGLYVAESSLNRGGVVIEKFIGVPENFRLKRLDILV